MENNSVIQENKHDEHCLIGYIGAFLGGIVGILPWMLLYLYSETNLLFLVALIPICALKGYQFFKGIVNKKTSLTIIIISIIVLLFSQIIVFPEWYGKKNDMNLKEFYESAYSSEYIEERVDELSASIMLIIFGFIFAYSEISKILNKYNLTNQMIKDTGTISLKNKSPIRGAEYNSFIKKSDKTETKVRIDEWDKTQSFIVTDPKASRLANVLRTNNTNTSSNQKDMNNEYNRKITINKKVKNFVVIIYMIVFFVLFGWIFVMIDNDIDDTNGYTYYFTNYDIKMNVPEEWEFEERYDGSVVAKDNENESESSFFVFEKSYFLNMDDFKSYIYNEIKYVYRVNSNPIINRVYLGENSGYLYYNEVSLNDNVNEKFRLFVYFIETENYYISHISATTLSYDVNAYTEYIESILSTIDDYGYIDYNYDNYNYDYNYNYNYDDYTYDY